MADSPFLADEPTDWILSIYAFFNPTLAIITVDGHCIHEFKCCACGCKVKVQRYLDKKDACSTGNMHKHVKGCCGDKVLQASDSAVNANEVRSKISYAMCKGKVTYSHQQHTHIETRAKIVQWVSEKYYIPSSEAVSHDIKQVFACTHKCIAKMLKEYDGKVHFTTDA
ncbi:hypothetical protein BS17DRAFT_798346 [Gyrodon lividus]|nr:hypothetical protein BS17DRAFT_798346 [Gyrodon lividus]